MMLNSAGKIGEDLYAIGDHRLPAFLFMGTEPVLFDAGMDFMGPAYLRDLKKYLGDPSRLKYLLLTHSHFDHSGAAPYLKRKISGLKIGASSKAAEIFQKASAVEFIRNLSRGAQKNFSSQVDPWEDSVFKPFNIDRILNDGDRLDLGPGKTVQVLATPGHTRDALSFYLPYRKALVAGEAVGVYNRAGEIQPEFLSGYEDYRASLQRLHPLEIDILMMAHLHVLTGEDARGYIAKSLEATGSFRKRIEDALRRFQGNQEKVVQEIFQEDYVKRKTSIQDQEPFRINLAAKVKAVAKSSDP